MGGWTKRWVIAENNEFCHQVIRKWDLRRNPLIKCIYTDAFGISYVCAPPPTSLVGANYLQPPTPPPPQKHLPYFYVMIYYVTSRAL